MFLQKLKPAQKKILLASLAVLTILFAEFLYFAGVYSSFPFKIPQTNLVVIYSGNGDRLGDALQSFGAQSDVRFLCSGWDYTRSSLEKILGPKAKLILEDKAKTTDQNARYSAPLIRESGAKSVVLALPWYHLPRALFLTRLYLGDSRIKVIPYAAIPLPEKWWGRYEFQLEFVKYWGSLGRVVLALFGIENWPKPNSM